MAWSFSFARKSALDGELLNFCLALIAKLCYDINAGGFGELRQTKYCQQICLVWTMPQHLKHKAFYYRKGQLNEQRTNYAV